MTQPATCVWQGGKLGALLKKVLHDFRVGGPIIPNARAQYIRMFKTAQDSISASVVASTKPIPTAAVVAAVAQHEPS